MTPQAPSSFERSTSIKNPLQDSSIALYWTVRTCYSFCTSHTTLLSGVECSKNTAYWASDLEKVPRSLLIPADLQDFRKPIIIPDLFTQCLTVLSLATNHSKRYANNSDQFQHDFITLLNPTTALGIWWDAKKNKTVKMKFSSYFSICFMRS